MHGAGGFRYGGVLLLTLAVALFALVAPDGGAVRTIELFAAGATLLVAVLTSRAPAATRRLAGVGVGGRRARRRHHGGLRGPASRRDVRGRPPCCSP